MKASLHIALERGSDASIRASGQLATPPLWCRWDGRTLWLVGSAASPVGRDQVEMHLRVGPGVHAEVRSVAAMVLYAGEEEGTSMLTTIEVGPGASLWWRPEPVVVTARARHRSTTRVLADHDGTAVVDELVVLGREDETAGTWHSTTELHLSGRPALLTSFDTSVPGWSGPGGTSGARIVATRLHSGTDSPPGEAAPDGTLLRGERGGLLAVALGDEADRARARLDDLLGPCPQPRSLAKSHG